MVHVPIHGNSTRPDGTSAVGPIVAIAAASAAGSFRAAGSRAILFSPVWLLDGCCTGNRTTDLVDRQPLFGLYQGSPQWAYLGVAHRFLVQNTRRSIYSDEVCCWSLCRKVSLANIDERLKSSLTSSMYESCLVRSLPGHSPLYYVAWQGPPCPKTPLEGFPAGHGGLETDRQIHGVQPSPSQGTAVLAHCSQFDTASIVIEPLGNEIHDPRAVSVS